MAPTSHLFPRQFGGGPGDRGDRNNGGVSTLAIVGVVIAIVFVIAVAGIVIFARTRRRKASHTHAGINLNSQVPPKTGPTPGQYAPPPGKPNAYGGGDGYQSTPDQHQSLLGNAEGPAIVTWDADQGVGSTQDGFGYNNAAAGIQRPASVASFSAPPPRYEEAAAAGTLVAASQRPRVNSESGLRPLMLGQGEAASYYNTSRSIGADEEPERGRSTTREASGSRRLSVDNRSVASERRRSVSRFREEGMVDLDVSSSPDKS
ncbi:uncharacterized protein Z518_08006 [Rhinocladiella mackenziei CBS 650.93]|uniref:Uncharacterized protein n=1 Tax=Rhinocladiella mackenziei CBS 650.93 TaxID=1442369 RepID=A0A0D2FJF9_9EURO|nr:uncharacterized protein Z518_08006 [Rhinocladiella mackenziei CBS 650.93]KIX02067.1 hypothetical protein Z518_08006 [Rhinocladiella mackenziei CBS 650.93]